MHYLYLVAVKKSEDIEKENLLNEVQNQLEQEGFASEGGFYSNSKADWFVMGGRWSGHLQEIKLKGWNEKAKELLNKNKADKECQFFTEADTKKNEKELQDLWESLGGVGRNVWNRDQYQQDGYEDDSMLLDKELYEALLAKGYKDTEVAIYDGYIEDEMLLADFLKDKEVVDNYYMVVVDYHN